MFDFLYSIPTPLLLPIFSFCGVFIYLTKKSLEKTYNIFCHKKSYFILDMDTDLLKEKWSVAVMFELICISLKAFGMVVIVSTYVSVGMLIYIILLTVTGYFLCYLPSFIFPSQYVLYSLNILFIINTIFSVRWFKKYWFSSLL